MMYIRYEAVVDRKYRRRFQRVTKTLVEVSLLIHFTREDLGDIYSYGVTLPAFNVVSICYFTSEVERENNTTPSM